MRQKFLLLAMLTCSLAWNSAKAAETEPNNTKATANTLTLNGSNTGAIGAATDEDWWAVTTTGDGKLDVTITSTNGQYISCYIYDNDGTTQLNAGTTAGSTTISTDGLATGTYYVRLVAYYGGGTPAYTISNALTVPAQANDAEPNGTRAQAKVFPLGGSRTGHVNYYYNLVRDSEDWYKITTTGDGKLDITVTSNNGQYMYCYLYDNDGITQLNTVAPSGTSVMSTDGLAAGTYYLRITPYNGNGFIPYTISNTFTTPSQSNDLEPNDTKAQALTLGLNSTTTGHIDYYYNNARDSSDWYKVTTTADGRLRLRMTPANGQYINCWLYDNDGTTQLNYFAPSTTTDLNTNGLAAGTYYIKVRSYYSNGYIPYILEDSLFSPAEPNDVEPNGTLAQATAFNLNSTKTGHINYYYNLTRDDDDWYKITTTLDGMISVTMTSGNGQYVQVWLYDNDGTTQLNYMAPSTTQTINTDGLAAGTYYVRIHTYYSDGYIPYTLSNTFTPYNYANDAAAEPNDAPYRAKTIPANGNITGHVNFYQNGNTRNTTDWWRINYTGTGNLTVNLYDEVWKINGVNHYKQIWIYKDTAASQIYYGAPAGDLTINLTSLTQGYYWIKITSYYGGDHIAYSLSNTFTQDNIATISY
ncbi:MAG TPA: pre-peptidase C-terminal domain-containing protein, partial [Panacibacter sp.]|nr:pre-peptidase C-terminal domain-containing protein [Panacibacter sp.]